MSLSSTRGIESALPGEWAALVVAVVVAGLVGGVVVAVACVLHERGVVRRGKGRGRAGN